MSITGFDSGKCAQRNRVAARKFGVNSVRVTFLKGSPRIQEDGSTVWSRGTLPTNATEALARINSRLPDGGTALTEEQVYIHYLEAANGNYIGDRYLFLSSSTLKNIALNAERGFAFMNSHRTGGMSHPSELPFGRTFAGRYEQSTDAEGKVTKRAIVGVYMLRGVKPNGDSGPSTDALHEGINAGTIFDVSVGLRGGEHLCDICGNELNATDSRTGEYLCPHVPGTTYALSADQQQQQYERGVDGGVATYTLHDAYCAEVSAVYDGAVPGAGFQKALALSKRGVLPIQSVNQARSAYSALMGKGEFDMSFDIAEVDERVDNALKRFMHRLGIGGNQSPQQLTAQFAEVQQHPVLTAVLAAGINTPEQFAALQSRAGERDSIATERDAVIVERDSLSVQVAAMKPKAEAYDQKFTTIREEADKALVALYLKPGESESDDLTFQRTILAGIPDGPMLERHMGELDKQFNAKFPQTRISAPNATTNAPQVLKRTAQDANGKPDTKEEIRSRQPADTQKVKSEY